MRLRKQLVLAAVLGLGLATSAHAADVIPGGNAGGIALGQNWGPYETYKGTAFRWVANDAELMLQAGSGEASIAIACEGGPSLGTPSFALRVLDGAHRQVDHVMCAGKDHPAMMLLPMTGGESRYVLHVDGGGKSVSGEKRILNFRVYTLDDGKGGAAAGGDIVDPRNGVRLGARWFPIEHFKGQTFRWMDRNDGQVFVTSDRAVDTKLRMLVEVGPSVGSRQAEIGVRDASGHALLKTTVKGRQAVIVPVHMNPGENEFVITVASPNRAVPNEKRILNLRAFSIAALR